MEIFELQDDYIILQNCARKASTLAQKIIDLAHGFAQTQSVLQQSSNEESCEFSSRAIDGRLEPVIDSAADSPRDMLSAQGSRVHDETKLDRDSQMLGVHTDAESLQNAELALVMMSMAEDLDRQSQLMAG
jgi:hypothetical protein